jgi:hypothetical protein
MKNNDSEPDIVVEGSNHWVVVADDEATPDETAVVPTTMTSKSPYLCTTGTAGSMNHTSVLTSTPSSNTSSNGSGGLSELSKQLRLLQNKNQNQSLEIEKLQRQLRILSELQNVNVNDIRSALEVACQAEAYGELQRRITSLRAELEVVQLTTATSTSMATSPLTATKASSNSTELTETSTMINPENIQNQQIIANLELRIGELEEIDEQRRTEIQQLYAQLQNQQTNSSQLQSKCDQLESEKEQLQLLLKQERQKYQEEQQKKKVTEVPTGNEEVRAVPVVMEDSSVKDEEIQKLQAANVAALAQVRESETWANMISEKLKLCEQQRDATENELKLRNVQYKARYLVQEENINDLRQQLISLYTAYDLVKEEKDRDDKVRNELQVLLGHADAEVARQVDEIDHHSQRGSYISMLPSSSSSSTPTTPLSSSIPYSDPNKSPVPTYRRDSTTGGTNTLDVVSPESPLMMDRSSASASSSSSLLMPRQPLQESAPIMSGTLLLKDTRGMIKKWRKRHVKLYATVSHFHLDVEEEKGYAIQIGISSVEIYTKYPYGISIYMGKRSGLSLIVAATNEKDFQDWMSVLLYATTGTEYPDLDVTTTPHSNAFRSVTPSSRSSSSLPYKYDHHTQQQSLQQQPHHQQRDQQNQPFSSTTLQDQQSSDLELALRLSEHEFQRSQQHNFT